ncbi:phage/plasmid primase, P4 family domain-containing protein [Lachnospiraceae bacterium MD308]|nr:phage/plasmid primase, P4 family domain-containing protein [Lachnospiraceae bacterium MD308]
MKMTFYTANCRGNAKNSIYPNKRVVDNEDDCMEVMAFDHVCVEFKSYRRSGDNFLSCDVDVMDCDNDHSDNPADWIHPEDLEEKIGKDVAFAVVPSRNNMKPKDGRSARPRFHVYFPHDPVTDGDACAALKKAVQQKFPFFDGNAIDSARFIFGNPCSEILWHEGEITIDCIVRPQGSREIPQGQRNATMSHFAGRVVKRYGATEKAYGIFMEEADKCSPPLEDAELSMIWQSACRFAEKVKNQDGYVAPDEYNDEFAGETLKPGDYSDIGQAKVLAREYGGELRYTAATDYLRFCGQYWVESKQQAVGAAEEFLDLQLEDAKDEVSRTRQALLDLGVSEDDIVSGGKALEKKISSSQTDAYLAYKTALAYKAFVMKRRDMKYIVSALQAAKPMLEISVSDLDKDGFLLNTPDGTYYLPDGLEGRRDHSSEDYITKITAAEPGDKGKELWEDSLNTIFCGDAELIDYVQQIVGMATVGRVYMESLVIAYGEGRNGKSTFWNTIARVLGTYSGNMSSDTLTVGCKRNVKPELAEAKGKRLIIAAELEEGMRLNTAVVKQMCSTDEIFAEKKYKDPFSFTPSHTLVLYTNHLPRVGANDPGTWRRLIVIPFHARIEGAGDVKNYADFLVLEAAPAVMAWIIEGAKKVISRNFHIPCPACVEDAIKSYREDNDWLGHFLGECCEVAANYTEKSGELYRAYRCYCAQTGEYARSTADFYNALEMAGFSRRRTKAGITVYGLRLQEEKVGG